jgi:predicted dehydrogenase
MKKIKTVALSGIGGYGMVYGTAFLEECKSRGLKFTGCIDPFPEKCDYIDQLREQNIPVYKRIEDFYKDQTADLMCIATPIHLHASQTCYALEHGSHVLCEKPLCATLEEAEQMLAVQKKSGLQVAIGYQYSFNPRIQSIKANILKGIYGKPILFKDITLGPRDSIYYQRGWAGKIKADGNYVYDSVANNACAHYLHNLFYLAGESMNISALPVSHETELYRANKIENFDTITTRIQTDSGIELYFTASHAIDRLQSPYFELEFEEAIIKCNMVTRKIETLAGNKLYLDSLAPDPKEREKIWAVIESINNNEPVACGIQTALSHTRFINIIQSEVEIQNFDEGRIIKKRNEQNPSSVLTYVDGLYDQLQTCFEKTLLLSESEG